MNQEMYIVKELWTSKQRQSNSLHEIAYRACFKAQLPNYFITQYSKKGDIVYDPFSGRGTTGIEASLLGRVPYFNDINPLSKVMSEPRIFIIEQKALEERFDLILKNTTVLPSDPIDLSMFFHSDTFKEISTIKNYLLQRKAEGKLDITDKWIKLLVLNRLTGHSSGFLSTYTLPPNQAVSPERQVLINKKYNNVIEYKSVKACCLKKYNSLIRNIDFNTKETLNTVNQKAKFFTQDAENTSEIQDNSIDLIITSPPFLDIVNYKQDNWMRCWFCGIDINKINISQFKKLSAWEAKMESVLKELKRVLKIGGHIAFEVGEIKQKKIPLEKSIIKIAQNINLKNIQVFINKQTFTKTSNIWGIDNNIKGTNSNRIILMEK